jgi:hypothetical protein
MLRRKNLLNAIENHSGMQGLHCRRRALQNIVNGSLNQRVEGSSPPATDDMICWVGDGTVGTWKYGKSVF